MQAPCEGRWCIFPRSPAEAAVGAPWWRTPASFPRVVNPGPCTCTRRGSVPWPSAGLESGCGDPAVVSGPFAVRAHVSLCSVAFAVDENAAVPCKPGRYRLKAAEALER